MRLPILALLGAIVATPALADPAPSAAPVVIAQPAPIAERVTGDQPVVDVADNAPAIFSEPTDPVPLLPSQRKLLRVRKV